MLRGAVPPTAAAPGRTGAAAGCSNTSAGAFCLRSLRSRSFLRFASCGEASPTTEHARGRLEKLRAAGLWNPRSALPGARKLTKTLEGLPQTHTSTPPSAEEAAKCRHQRPTTPESTRTSSRLPAECSDWPAGFTGAPAGALLFACEPVESTRCSTCARRDPARGTGAAVSTRLTRL